MKLAPLGIFGLVASLVQDTGIRVLSMLVNFLFTFAVASLRISLFLVCLDRFFIARCHLSVSLKICGESSVISFTTTSSAVSLPFQIEDGKEKLGISDRINKLVMPLAMTLNSNGLALFFVTGDGDDCTKHIISI
jgi:Na+/H+-dicarboxylate symporter